MNQEEKINYIYETLKKQEKRYLWSIWSKWIFRIIIIGYIYYSFVYLLPGYIDNIKKSLTPDITTNFSKTINNLDKKELLKHFKSLIIK